MAVLIMPLLVFMAAAERPADTQRLDDLSRDSRQSLNAIQQATEPAIPAAQAAYQQHQQLRLQANQRNELLRQHYRDKMVGRSPEHMRLEGIARQRRYQRQQADQLRWFGQASGGAAGIRSTTQRHRPARDPLAPLRR